MRLLCVAVLAIASACSKAEKRAGTPVVCDAEGSDHDSLYQRGVDLIEPHMVIMDRKAAPRNDAEIRVGIACIDRVLQINPKNWSALWVRGKGLQSLGEHRIAIESFLAAYHLNSDDPEMGRELGAELLEAGRFADAVQVDRTISNQRPQDAGLKANLALALLLNGEPAAAQQTVAEALALDPNDAITKALAQEIADVSTGKRPRPKSFSELRGGN